MNTSALNFAEARRKAASPSGLTVGCAGDSMLPTLRFGQSIDVHADRPRIGDIVLIAGPSPILHRLVVYVPKLPWVLHCGDNPSVSAASLARAALIVGVVRGAHQWPKPHQWRLALREVGASIWRHAR